MGGIVGLSKVKSSLDIRRAISESLELTDFSLSRSPRTVVIKPNLCYYWDSDSGYTTDRRVVAAIIDLIREKFGSDLCIKIAEADASAMRTRLAFRILGYDKLAEEKNVELFNLSSDLLIDRTSQVGDRDIKYEVPRSLLDVDLLINVPKLKIMRATKITCAMKNIFGAIGYQRKIIYHPYLDEAIVGINKILKPHLTVVDGVVALSRFPIKLGLLMVGTESFSVDWVASEILGYDPRGVKFLKLAIDEGMGSPKGIDVKGEKIDSFQRLIPKKGLVPISLLWAVQFNLLKAYNMIVGDIVPPFLEEA